LKLKTTSGSPWRPRPAKPEFPTRSCETAIEERRRALPQSPAGCTLALSQVARIACAIASWATPRTQQELATRAKTSYSAISRLEGGRHATHLETLHRIFAALGADLLVGYEVRADDESRKKRERELVAV
jgi:hypothetical protein